MFYKEDTIRLTVAVYQVTGIFPENEPLIAQIRQKANNVLADFICLRMNPGNKKNISKGIEVLFAYFSIAEKQNWIDSKNFLVLRREYSKILDFIRSLPENPVKIARKEVKIIEKTSYPQVTVDKRVDKQVDKKQENRNVSRASSNPSVRQKQVLELIKTKNQLSLSEIKSMFSSLSSRTLRRDLSSLVDKGAIDRIREGRDDVLYVLK
ncbi:DeoR family transcriptional regulator [Patescibacteria group bacterium]|nr:DeoR family transcriptional regulator [Patescibacteria group bacterium]MBU4162355.1 DeoR family transcriptional regulator [Patescibacteria group bacterium]